MTPYNPYSDLSEAIALVQGETYSAEELEIALSVPNQAIAKGSQDAQRAAYNVVNSDDPWVSEYEITNGKILNLGISTAIGFFSGGGWIGAGLAFAGGLLSMFQKKPKEQKQGEERQDVQYGFDSGGSLGRPGTPFPLVYGNRNIDPSGGVRVGGFLIHSRIDTALGGNKLFQIYAISLGESPSLGLGALGAIDESETLFNGQPRSNFDLTEIESHFRTGAQVQAPIPGFDVYSMNHAPPDYAVFGVDFRASAEGSADAPTEPENVVGGTLVNGLFTKTGLLVDWDAGIYGGTGLAGDGTFTVTPQQVAGIAAGLSSNDTGVSFVSIEYGWYFDGANQAFVIENGAFVQGPYAYVAGQGFDIVSAGGQIQYVANGVLVYTSVNAPNFPLFPDASIQSPGASVQLDLNGTGVTVATGGTTTITIKEAEERFDLFNFGQDFVVCRDGDPAVDPHFRVVGKDDTAEQLTIEPALNIVSFDALFAYWSARYENLKHVERVDFNLSFQLTALESREDRSGYGKERGHANLFDVYARPVTDAPGTEVFMGRFVVAGKRRQVIRRALRFHNLPLGRYYWEFRPLCQDPKDQPVWILLDTGNFRRNNAANTLAGATIEIEAEMIPIIEEPDWVNALDDWISFTNKMQVSSESGPTGKIASVNEIVVPDAPPEYPGVALYALVYTASERLQQPPGQRCLVTAGREIQNLMAAGEASALSTPTTLEDPTADFVADGIQTGWVIRDLSGGNEAQITAVTATTITTTTPLNWDPGCRYLVYFIGSSCYFPDIFNDLAINDYGGIRELIEPDDDIDYEYLVESRKFCVAEQLYAHTLYERSAPFKRQMLVDARESLLLPSERNGRIGLRPERLEPVVDLFNASKDSNFKESWADWQSAIVNRLIVTYLDGRELFEEDGSRHRDKTVVMELPGVFNGTDFVQEETLRLSTVTRPEQAIRVGTVYFNSARLQNRNVTFSTGPQAMFIEGGDIVSVQHPTASVGEELSGMVKRIVEPFDAVTGQQVVQLDCSPCVLKGRNSEASDDGVVGAVDVDYGTTAVMPGDLLVNLTCGGECGVITAVAGNQIVAPVVLSRGDRWEVLNLTTPADLFATVQFRETGEAQSNLAFGFELTGECGVALRVYGLANGLQRGDGVNIGGAYNTYRIQRAAPSGKYGFSINATYYPGEELYDSSGFVISYDEVILNEPT